MPLSVLTALPALPDEHVEQVLFLSPWRLFAKFGKTSCSKMIIGSEDGMEPVILKAGGIPKRNLCGKLFLILYHPMNRFFMVPSIVADHRAMDSHL